MIWGAAGGIGRSLTALLGNNGWDVVAVSRDGTTIPGSKIAVAANIANAAAVDQAVYTVSLEADPITLWVYAAGDIVQTKVDEMQADVWQRIIDANLTGAYLTAHASLPLLTADAHMFFLGAISERLRLPSLSAYVAAKTGLEAFVATFAREQRKRPITLVRPGAVDTPFWDKVTLRKPADAATPDQIAQRIWQAYQEKSLGTLDITH
jgi:NAD(P)-dependent dehydrogenase (short-subunit alcohol dehydrogenase family)